MKCCNQDCRQGRDCPNKPVGDVPLYRVLAVASVVIAATMFIAFVTK